MLWRLLMGLSIAVTGAMDQFKFRYSRGLEFAARIVEKNSEFGLSM